jgi:hypothetical protein
MPLLLARATRRPHASPRSPHPCLHLPTHPASLRHRGVFPLSRASVKKVARGASGFGISLSSPEIAAGKELVLGMSSERQRDSWFAALERAALVYVPLHARDTARMRRRGDETA